ncbi:MAG: DsrE family protein [Oligoflexales bacterium]
MSKKILSIVDTAYRATLEEQDDTSLWFNHACKNAGAPIDILLTGNAVNYAVKSQNPQALHFGTGEIPHPNHFQEDLKNFKKTGANVFFLKDDLEERGIKATELIKEIEGISRAQLARFVDQYDHIWHW